MAWSFKSQQSGDFHMNGNTPHHADHITSIKQTKSDIGREIYKPSGGRLNKKDGLTRYGDSHNKDKTS